MHADKQNKAENCGQSEEKNFNQQNGASSSSIRDEKIASKGKPHEQKITGLKASNNILECIGSTPLICFRNILTEYKISNCKIYAKCEYRNPTGSSKDRIALKIIDRAEEEKKITRGVSTLIVPSSGNLGISVALIGIHRSYRVVALVPESINRNKKLMLHGLGAKLWIMPKSPLGISDLPNHPEGAKMCATKLQSQIVDSYIVDQYEDGMNPLTHYQWTAGEILKSVEASEDKPVDMLVCGIESGGLISGIGTRLKETNPHIQIVGVELESCPRKFPRGSENLTAVLKKCEKESEIEDMGCPYRNYNPPVLDTTIITKWISVSDSEAFQMTRRLIQKEGVLCGPSGGAVVAAALTALKELGSSLKMKKKDGYRVVVVIPEALRQCKESMLKDLWMQNKGFYGLKEMSQRSVELHVVCKYINPN